MTLDVRPALATILDGVTANAGGRKQRFKYLPWGHAQDDRRWAAIQSATVAGGTAPDSVITTRQVANPTSEASIGGNAARNRQTIDVMVWWQDGADVTGPDAWRDAVVRAVTAVIRANRRTTTPAKWVQVIDVRDGDTFLGAFAQVADHLAVITIQAEAHEVYG